MDHNLTHLKTIDVSLAKKQSSSALGHIGGLTDELLTVNKEVAKKTYVGTDASGR